MDERVDEIFNLFIGYDDACEDEPWRRKQVAEWLEKQDEEVRHLREQRDDLQRRCGELLTQARGLRYQVDEFHEKFGHPRPREIVQEPPEELVRFRLRLIAEEFFEVFDAVLGDYHTEPWLLHEARRYIRRAVEEHPVELDFSDLIDGLADLDYVVEGTRVSLGIDGRPIAAEVHRANMAKGPNGPDSKPVKPSDWKPPDIEGELRKQGWKG